MLADRRSRLPDMQITIDPPRGRTAVCPAESPVRNSCEDVALVVTEGAAMGTRVPIGSAPVIIGRGVGVDLQVADPTVSRHHCVVWRASGRCWVRDLGSTNHTRVNNRSALITELFDGDVVVMGQTTLTLAANGRSADAQERAKGHAEPSV